MGQKLVLVQPQRSLQHIIASLLVGGFALAASHGVTRLMCGDLCSMLATVIATGVAGYGFASALLEARRAARSRRALMLLPDLLSEGIEAEVGRLTLVSHYTSEGGVKRSYVTTLVFKPEGEAQLVSMETLAEWKFDYAIVAKDEEGILLAKAARLQVNGLKVYLVKLHTSVDIEVARARLLARSGEEYGEAIIRQRGGRTVVVVSHIGKFSKARLVVEVTNPYEVRYVVGEVRNRARSFQLAFSPLTDTILLVSEGSSIDDLTRVLGYRRMLLAMGTLIEGRIRLEIVRGVRRIAVDEAKFSTHRSD